MTQKEFLKAFDKREHFIIDGEKCFVSSYEWLPSGKFVLYVTYLEREPEIIKQTVKDNPFSKDEEEVPIKKELQEGAMMVSSFEEIEIAKKGKN